MSSSSSSSPPSAAESPHGAEGHSQHRGPRGSVAMGRPQAVAAMASLLFLGVAPLLQAFVGARKKMPLFGALSPEGAAG